MKKKIKKYWELYKSFSLGLSVVFSVVIGGVIGYFLDKRFPTKYHILFLMFLFYGIGAAFWNIYREWKRLK